jgi:hypothetical protein
VTSTVSTSWNILHSLTAPLIKTARAIIRRDRTTAEADRPATTLHINRARTEAEIRPVARATATIKKK